MKQRTIPAEKQDGRFLVQGVAGCAFGAEHRNRFGKEAKRKTLPIKKRRCSFQDRVMLPGFLKQSASDEIIIRCATAILLIRRHACIYQKKGHGHLKEYGPMYAR